MNRKRIKMYWEMDAPKEVQKKIVRNFAIVLLIEVIVMIANSLYLRLDLIESELHYKKFHSRLDDAIIKELTNSMWDRFVGMTKIPQVTCLIVVLLCWMLPFYGIYRHYYGSNSIYTLMRLPGSRKEFYFSKLIPGIVLPVLVYGVCSILYMIPNVMYRIFIPETYQVNVSYIDIEQFFMNAFIAIVLFLYIPSMLIMSIFAERSRKRPIYTVIAIGIVVSSMWISTPFFASVLTMGSIQITEFILGVLASVICIIGGVYYIERVQLV